MQWLMFQMGGVGPMQGQANMFHCYFPEKIPAAIECYQSETKRLYGVLNVRLAQHEFLAGDYSITDIAHWSWGRIHNWVGGGVDELPHLRRWLSQLESRAALAKGASQTHSTDYNNPDAG